MDHFDRLLNLTETLRAVSPRGRYAPSPTGPLHLGNLRAALLAWLHTRLAGGVFVLRIEDLDLARKRAGGTEQNKNKQHKHSNNKDEDPDKTGPSAPYV